MATSAIGIYEISDGRFALGRVGKMARAVVQRLKGGKFIGVRGRRPTITEEARRVPKYKLAPTLVETFERLGSH